MERRAHGRILAGVLTLTTAAGIPLAATSALLTMPTVASAQVLQVTPWFAFVESDDAVIRCGHGDLMYPVAHLKKGQILRVDGEGQGWARVSYPAAVPAFVPANAVRVNEQAGTATLTQPSRLKAFNATTGLRGSWKDLFDNALPAGTRLRLLGDEPTPDGRGNSAWKVAPPDNARGFIAMSALRRATPEEVKAFEAKLAEESSAQPQPVRAEASPRPETAEGPRPTPVTDRTAPAAEEGPAQRATPAPEPSERRAVRPAPQQRAPAPNRYDRLESAFEAVRKQDPDQAEFAELLAEFESAIASLDDSQESKRIRSRLQQRMDFLRLRADLQEQRRRFAEIEAQLSEEDEILARRLAEVERARQYTVVGRLSASTIYDGERLPLMYRVQTVGGPTSRTIAYVRPDDKLNIERRLGQLVGIQGEKRMDPTLRLNIITPQRVDALEATATAVVPEGN